MVFDWLTQHHLFAKVLMQTMIAVGVILLSAIAYFITRRFIIPALEKLINRDGSEFGRILIKESALNPLAYLAPLIVVHIFAPQLPFQDIIQKVSVAVIIWLVLLTVGSLLNILHDIYLALNASRGRSIKGYIQVTKLIIYIVGGVIIVSSLFGRSPAVLLSGIGAMTAIVLLIFRDTILSFVASLQITSNDLVRVGDWIEAPKFEADGDVIDIALHTITVQNWDKTLTIIPTHKLIDESFKNWRGMQRSGGRRIKRAIYIDLDTIKFCDEEMVERFKKYRLISDYIEGKQKELAEHHQKLGIDDKGEVPVNVRRLTNIGTFRAYVIAYLKNNEKVRQDMTFLVRQLPPGPTGLPLEIYVFANDVLWANYEAIQADIFDHILAVVPEFGLKLFQNPTGRDFGRLAAGSGTGDRNQSDKSAGH